MLKFKRIYLSFWTRRTWTVMLWVASQKLSCTKPSSRGYDTTGGAGGTRTPLCSPSASVSWLLPTSLKRWVLRYTTDSSRVYYIIKHHIVNNLDIDKTLVPQVLIMLLLFFCSLPPHRWRRQSFTGTPDSWGRRWTRRSATSMMSTSSLWWKHAPTVSAPSVHRPPSSGEWSATAWSTARSCCCNVRRCLPVFLCRDFKEDADRYQIKKPNVWAVSKLCNGKLEIKTHRIRKGKESNKHNMRMLYACFERNNCGTK